MDNKKLAKLNFQIHFIICVLAILVVAGCDHQQKPETPIEISRRHERMAARALKETAEKIVFISTMVNTSFDTIFHVLLDYKLKTEYIQVLRTACTLTRTWSLEIFRPNIIFQRKKSQGCYSPINMK